MDYPFHVVDEVVEGGSRHTLNKLHNRVQGKPAPVVTHRRLLKTDANGHAGQVEAHDIQNDSEYIAQVTIGTPGQSMNLCFDTGSADLWTWSNELPKSTVTAGKSAHHNIYDHARSSTFKPSPGES